MRYGLIFPQEPERERGLRYERKSLAVAIADWFSTRVMVFDYEAKMIVYRNW